MKALAIALVASAFFGATETQEREDRKSFGDAITVTAMGDVEISIPAADKKATVLIFLSSDCPIANKYAPEIRRIQKRFEAEGVAFYRVYGDSYHDPEDLVRHTREYDYTMPAILDTEQRIVHQSGASVTPEAVVLNEAGDITYRGRINDRFVDFGRYRQHAKDHDLIDAIAATLDGKTPPNPRTKAIGCFIPSSKKTESKTE